MEHLQMVRGLASTEGAAARVGRQGGCVERRLQRVFGLQALLRVGCKGSPHGLARNGRTLTPQHLI
jgi:hypothetical protein